MFGFLGKFLVKISSQFPGHWSRICIVTNSRQHKQRAFHDPEFRFFEFIKDCPGTVIDIGANHGQAAISILANTNCLKLISYEPNRSHWLALTVLKWIYPGRFKFKIMALGEVDGTMLLNVPTHSKSDLSGSATLKLEELNKSYVWDRFRHATKQQNPEIEIDRKTISVQKLDNFKLIPDVIKIDVEGFESEVLAGAHQTLVAHKPVLFIETHPPNSWMPFLETLGYAFFRVGGSQSTHLKRVDRPGDFVNMLALHPGSTSIISKKLSVAAD